MVHMMHSMGTGLCMHMAGPDEIHRLTAMSLQQTGRHEQALPSYLLPQFSNISLT